MREDDGTEINPLYVRHQLCLESLNEVIPMEDFNDKVTSMLCCLAAFYDGVSGDILEHYIQHVDLPLGDPLVEREVKERVNAFHVADLLRIVEPGDNRWIDPENEGGFKVLVDDSIAEFFEQTRIQSRKFRGVIEESIQEYLATHD